MTRRRIRFLLVASFLWLLLVAAGAYLTRPLIGPIAASIEPNPFWDVIVTGNAAVPFQVGLKAASWLVWCLAPIAVMWLLGSALARRQPRRGP